MAFSTPGSLRPDPSTSKKTPFTSTTGILSGALIFSLVVLYFFTPWPSVLPIRYAANHAAFEANRSLNRHVPGNVIVIRNIQYDIKDQDAELDVYLPPQVPVGKSLPMILWLHGGDWVSGSGDLDSNYCKILSAKGLVVVSVNYSRAPEKHYPAPLRQVNAALDFLVKNADKFSINQNRIFLAGEGSGAQLAAQLANLTVNTTYATLLKVNPAIQPKQLSGCILYNGCYDFNTYETKSEYATHMQTVLWCYSGARAYHQNAYFRTASVKNFIAADYPPCYIAATGEKDNLHQSTRLAAKLAELKVNVKTCFLKSESKSFNKEKSLFDLDKSGGQKVLLESIEFINKISGN